VSTQGFLAATQCGQELQERSCLDDTWLMGTLMSRIAGLVLIAAVSVIVGEAPGTADAEFGSDPGVAPVANTSTSPSWGIYDPASFSVDRFLGFIVDDGRNQLFFLDTKDTAFNTNTTTISVTTLDGELIKEISVPGRDTKITINDEGSTVWVVSDAKVYSIDTTSLVLTLELTGTCTRSAIEWKEFLITSGDCEIVARDLNDLSSVVHTVPNSGGVALGGLYLEVIDVESPVLLMVDQDITPIALHTVDLVTWELIAVSPDRLPNVRGIAVDPDGSRVLLSGSPGSIESYSIPDLVKLPRFADVGAAQMAFMDDGTLLASVNSFPSGSNMVRRFAPGTSIPSRIYHVLDNTGVGGFGLSAGGESLFVVSVRTENQGEPGMWINTIDLTSDPGSMSGTLRHGFSEFHNGVAPLGHVEIYNDQFEYLATADAAPDGTYQIDEIAAGTYFGVFWNGEYGSQPGEPNTIFDFFPQLFENQPLFGVAKPIVVTAGQETAGVDAFLAPLFFDMFGHTFADDIYWLGNAGVTKGCNPPENSLFCPDDPVSRGQMAAFLTRAFVLSQGSGDSFVDDDGSIFEADIERLAAAGITKGCNPPANDQFCPDASVTRGQMAAFLNRVMVLPPPGGATFGDDDGSPFETDIERLAAAGITKGCNPPENDKFCPDTPVTRGQMAAFLKRAFAYLASTAPQAASDVSSVSRSGDDDSVTEGPLDVQWLFDRFNLGTATLEAVTVEDGVLRP